MIVWDAVISLAIGVLAGFGVGSGGILILYLVAVDGMGQLAAQGVNLAIFSFALFAAVLVHLHRRELPLPILGFVVGFGAVGAVLGSVLAQILPAEGLRMGLGWLLLVMGTVALIRK